MASAMRTKSPLFLLNRRRLQAFQLWTNDRCHDGWPGTRRLKFCLNNGQTESGQEDLAQLQEAAVFPQLMKEDTACPAFCHHGLSTKVTVSGIIPVSDVAEPQRVREPFLNTSTTWLGH